jgi:hypothetical protein
MRKLAIGKFAAAALSVPFAFSCAAQKNAVPIVEVTVPATVGTAQGAADIPGPDGRTTTSIPTEMTLLRTGDTFLAYVSVPDDGTVRDLQDAPVDFSFTAPGGRWAAISGCIHVSVCDASYVIRSNPSGLTVRADFSGQGYAPASSTFPVPAGGP